jgi:cytochrome P450
MDASRRLPEIIDSRRYGLRGYPHELWTALRREPALRWFEGEGIKPFWAVTRHRDLQAIGEKPELFLNAPRIMADLDVRPNLVWSRHLLNMDPPEHDDHRALVAARFSARTLKSSAPRVHEIVAGALARFATPGGEEGAWQGDFVEEVAQPIAVTTIAELLGIPAAERARLARWAHAMVAPSDPAYRRGRSIEETYLQAERDLFGWFAPRIVERRTQSGDDLVSALCRAELGGKPLEARTLLSFCQLFVTAGIDTTSAALSRAVHALAEHPDQFRWLRDHPDQVPIAAEELLRWASPVIHFCRTAAENVEIGGAKVQRGQTLVLFYPSANRDEEVFDRPSELRLDRPKNPHLAFGAGIHYCLGATIARMLLHELLTQLIARVDQLEVAAPPEHAHSSVIGGIRRLALRCRLARR